MINIENQDLEKGEGLNQHFLADLTTMLENIWRPHSGCEL